MRVVDADLRDRMSEWVVMHALIHLRQLQALRAPAARSHSGRTTTTSPRPATFQVGVLGLGVLGHGRGDRNSRRSASRVLGMEREAKSERPESKASAARTASTPSSSRTGHARRAFAPHDGDARHAQRLAVRQTEAGWPARGAGADQCRTREAYRSKPTSSRRSTPASLGRLAGRIRTRAPAAFPLRLWSPSGRLCEPAQRRHLRSRRSRRPPLPARSKRSSAASRCAMWWIGSEGIELVATGRDRSGGRRRAPSLIRPRVQSFQRLGRLFLQLGAGAVRRLKAPFRSFARLTIPADARALALRSSTPLHCKDANCVFLAHRTLMAEIFDFRKEMSIRYDVSRQSTRLNPEAPQKNLCHPPCALHTAQDISFLRHNLICLKEAKE